VLTATPRPFSAPTASCFVFAKRLFSRTNLDADLFGRVPVVVWVRFEDPVCVTISHVIVTGTIFGFVFTGGVRAGANRIGA